MNLSISAFFKRVLRTDFLSPLKLSILTGIICFAVFNANLRQIGAGDTLPARYLPLIIWQSGTLKFDEHTDWVTHAYPLTPERDRPPGAKGAVNYLEPNAYWLVRTRDHNLASLYPVVTPLLVAPLYAPAALWLDAHNWQQPEVDRAAELMEKISASLIASFACILMFLILRREENPWALPLTLAFAFGTNTWMISSQALWQHGMGELLIAAALLLATSKLSPVRLALLGAVCVLMTGNRPPDGLIAAGFGIFVLFKMRRDTLWFLGGAALPLIALIYYNLFFVGHLAGGYGMVKPSAAFFQPFWSGLAGLLISPTRGLLVFSPFFIFLPFGILQRLRDSRFGGLTLALAVSTSAQILFYSLGDWRGGVSWGPRWLTDILPILIWFLAPAPRVLRTRGRAFFIFLTTFSIGVQAIGAFGYQRTSDQRIFANGQASMRAAWDPRNLPFLVEARHLPVRGRLYCGAEGAFGRIGDWQSGDDSEIPNPAIPILQDGTLIEGWTTACGRPPAKVLLLIDGIIIGTSENSLSSADSGKTATALNWRITANTQGVPNGERLLQMVIYLENPRIVSEQRVIVAPQKLVAESETTPLPNREEISLSDLATRATQAAALLGQHQRVDGSWLTSHTQQIEFKSPTPELNTFLTAMLVDLLAPVSRRQNLDPALESARRHLAAQIENTGLVRYHGLPTAPTIGKLGCAITPDADDTALTWRITGYSADDTRIPPMLAELSRYRDARGLYRTWLSAQKNYQCLDPGTDPNPTDLTIQMHVYLMLREFDPPAAVRLCDGLKRHSADDDVTVYYAKSSLIPYLRGAELRQLGCEIPLPTERLMLPARGQEIWSAAVYKLAQTFAATPNNAEQQEIAALLRRLSDDDFALLRNSPPLLYHNDLSATVRRYYFSEDFGYALWLRLFETIRSEDEKTTVSRRR